MYSAQCSADQSENIIEIELDKITSDLYQLYNDYLANYFIWYVFK